MEKEEREKENQRYQLMLCELGELNGIYHNETKQYKGK